MGMMYPQKISDFFRMELWAPKSWLTNNTHKILYFKKHNGKYIEGENHIQFISKTIHAYFRQKSVNVINLYTLPTLYALVPINFI